MHNSRNIKNTLDNLFKKNDKVFIVPHNRPDMDALGAAIGMSLICSKKGKDNYIIINDDVEKLESVTKKVLKNIIPRFKIIKESNLEKYITDKSLMLAVDVNKDYLVSVKDDLDKFNDIVILDHHKEDEHTIKSQYRFIDDKLSSACEEVARLTNLYRIKMCAEDANYILAGILLDTNKLTSPSVSKRTSKAVNILTKKGASKFVASSMFADDEEQYKRIQKLISNVVFLPNGNAISIGNSEDIFELEDIAKVADYFLKYRVNATFVAAYIDKNYVSISARSKGLIDVSKIMRLFGGSGAEFRAAARIQNTTIDEVKNKLYQILMPTTYLDQVDINKEEGPTLKLVQ